MNFLVSRKKGANLLAPIKASMRLLGSSSHKGWHRLELQLSKSPNNISRPFISGGTTWITCSNIIHTW